MYSLEAGPGHHHDHGQLQQAAHHQVWLQAVVAGKGTYTITTIPAAAAAAATPAAAAQPWCTAGTTTMWGSQYTAAAQQQTTRGKQHRCFHLSRV